MSLLHSMCFVLAVTSASGFQPADRTALKAAVEAWCTDSTVATTTYGDINTWDVRTPTHMHPFFVLFTTPLPMTNATPCPSYPALILSCRCLS